HLDPPLFCARIRIDRFSPYHQEPTRFGLTNLHPHPAYAHVYPFKTDVLSRIAYFFECDHADGAEVERYCAPMVAAVQRWNEREQRQEFVAEVTPEEVFIRDTRFGPEQTIVLRSLEREVYLLCDEPRSLSTLRDLTGKTETELLPILGEF